MLTFLSNLMHVALFIMLCLLISREMYLYVTHDTSGWTDYATAGRLIIVTLLTMSWVYVLKQEHHASSAGILIISAFIIALLNTAIVIVGQLLKASHYKLPKITAYLVIAITTIIALSVATIVLFNQTINAAPYLYQAFIITSCLWLILIGINVSIVIAQKISS